MLIDREEEWDGFPENEPHTINEFILSLEVLKKKHGEDTAIAFGTTGYDSPTACLYYKSPETDVEMALRTKKTEAVIKRKQKALVETEEKLKTIRKEIEELSNVD